MDFEKSFNLMMVYINMIKIISKVIWSKGIIVCMIVLSIICRFERR